MLDLSIMIINTFKLIIGLQIRNIWIEVLIETITCN